MANRTAVKEVKNAVLWSDGCITVEDVRASYPHVDKVWAKDPTKETPAWSITGLLNKKTHREAFELIRGEMDACILANQKVPKGKVGGLPKDRKFLRNGDDKVQNPECHGCWYIATREKEENRPAVRDVKGRLIVDPVEIRKLILPGYRVDILFRPWFMDHVDFGQRCNANLYAVRFRAIDEVIGDGMGAVDDDGAFRIQDDDDGDNGFGGDDADGL